jgi:hypothetical protein
LGDVTTGFDPAMKFATARPYAAPESAARKLVEIANSVEAVQDGRIHIALLNGHQSDSKQQSRDSSGPRGIRSGNLLCVKDFYLPNVKREEAWWQLTNRSATMRARVPGPPCY